MLVADKSCKTIPLTEIIRIFRSAMLAVIPHVEKVGVRWKKWETYDDWDRIEEALFESMVSKSIEFIFGEGQTFGLPLINNTNFDPKAESLLFDEELGQEFRFLALTHDKEPFNTARFMASDPTQANRDIIEKPLELCNFLVLARARNGDDAQITNLGCIG
jgi:hypothetical protein